MNREFFEKKIGFKFEDGNLYTGEEINEIIDSILIEEN